MEEALAAVGMLFMLFLVVATASEQIVEAFRGVLQAFGITKLKGGVTVAEATKLSAEFMPPGSEARAKAEAMLAVAKDYPQALANKKTQIEQAVQDITTALATIGPGAQGIEQATMAVNKLALEVSTIVGKTEQVRMTVLRVLSLAVCIALCWFTSFNALDIVAKAYPKFGVALGSGNWAVGLLGTAIAASAGSSYWHDMLDKVRAAKTALTSIQTAAAA